MLFVIQTFDCFNTQPPEGGWKRPELTKENNLCFNTQPPEGGWCLVLRRQNRINRFNTQPPEGGWVNTYFPHYVRSPVSTHSRPKAAGRYAALARPCLHGFNTQPPEGGWRPTSRMKHSGIVSTHSRPKAAGGGLIRRRLVGAVSTHSRPKAAGRLTRLIYCHAKSFNTQPPEGGWINVSMFITIHIKFQHTAARRRLVLQQVKGCLKSVVSTHSRPKAAGRR